MTASTVRISMPYAAGALGGTVTERGGVVNIALEGMMLGGAFAYVAVAYQVHNAWAPAMSAQHGWVAPVAGLLAALATGFALSLVHALATVVFKANHIISGFAINILSLGGTNFLLKHIFESSSNSPRCPTFSNWQLFAADSPLAVMNQLMHPLIALILLLLFLSHWALAGTRFGLRLKAVGENPQAADSLGVSVTRYQISGVLLGGVIASIGGVWLASDQGLFTSNMTAGRGYIALAAMIVGKWRPWGAALACLIFGLAETLQNQMQLARQAAKNLDGANLGWFDHAALAVPSQLIQCLPYVLTLIVIAGLVGRSTPPAAVGVPFEKEKD